MENFVAFASTLYCKILVGALIIELVVIWLCKKKIIKKDKITSALSVGLVALALAICFPIYSMEKIKDIPYQTISYNQYNIVKIVNENGTRVKAVVQDVSGKTKNIFFYTDRFDIGSSEGEKHLQVFAETTGTSYIEEKFMEKKNPLIRSQYKQIVVHLSKEDMKKIK